MGDILSQDEIDALLNALTSGNTDNIVLDNQHANKREAKDYDFARPSKFSKEQLRTLEIIFDNFARLVSSFLTGYMRTSTHIEVANAEQLTYNEFSNSMVNPVVLAIIDFVPLKGSVILELSSNVSYSIIDRILGGPGVSIKKLREFSEIEKILMERVISQMLNHLIEPWENVISNLKPKLDKLETNSQFAQIISPNEMIALVTLSIKVGSSEGLMNFCIPHMVIEPIIERLNTKYWFRQEDEEQVGFRDDISEQIEKALVPVSAVIGRTTIMVNDFVNLQVGDIIPLDSYITSDVSVMVGNLLKFYAKPGTNRGKNAIQITSFVEKEE